MSEVARFLPARPHPVAVIGPPVDELAGEAARAWLVATIEARPLAGTDGELVDRIVQQGPRLCDALLRAMGSDAELAWLTTTAEGQGLIASCLEYVGGEPAAVVEAVENLRAGVWRAVGVSLASHGPEALVAAGDRLAHVCALTAAGAVAGAGPLSAPANAAADPEDAAPPARSDQAAARRGSEPAASWTDALERQLVEGGRWGRQFALLLVEVDGSDHLRVAGGGRGARDPLAGVGRAVRERLRGIDVLAHEDGTRLWVIAPGCGNEGAMALASRLADGVREAGTRRVPLSASVGVSMYPRDGRDATALTERAEEQMFAARAAGVPVAGPETGEPVPG